MKRKLSIGQKVEVKIWHDETSHWLHDCGFETFVGTIVGLPEPTYRNNWNYNPTEFDIQVEDGKIIHVGGRIDSVKVLDK